MQIVLRDESRRLIGRIDVNESLRPTRVPISEPPKAATTQSPLVDAKRVQTTHSGAGSEMSTQKEAFLNWETALDDAGQLRRCVACGCTDLFIERAFPAVTGAVVVLAFIGAAMGALGLAEAPPVLIGMGIVLVLDVAILIFSRRRLVCYHCRSTYRDLPIAPYHKPWDRSVALRHPATPAATMPPSSAAQPQITAPDVTLPAVIRTAPASAGANDKDYFA